MSEIKDSVGWYMLRTARALIISQKWVFEKAIIAFAKFLPEPNTENVDWPNTLILMRIRDKFFSYFRNAGKLLLFESAWKILIDIPEHDPFYRDVPFQWLLEELVESVMSGEWQPRTGNDTPPERLWAEPRPRGNFNGRKFKELIRRS